MRDGRPTHVQDLRGMSKGNRDVSYDGRRETSNTHYLNEKTERPDSKGMTRHALMWFELFMNCLILL